MLTSHQITFGDPDRSHRMNCPETFLVELHVFDVKGLLSNHRHHSACSH